MTNDEFDAKACELVGDRDGFARIGHVVADRHRDLLAQDAARSIDVGDGLACADP
jgi:hypothetical protein